MSCTLSQIPGVFLVQQAFQSLITIFRIVATGIVIDPMDFLGGVYSKVDVILKNRLESYSFNIKVNFELFGEYEQQTTGKREVKSHLTKAVVISSPDQISQVYEQQKGILLRKSQEFEEKDSGWALLSWCWLELRVSKYSPLAGSSYIDLPKQIKDKKAVLNIQNDDDLCFKWSILAAFHPAGDNPHRISHYTPYTEELNFDRINFPVSLNDIEVFEQLNDIIVNVYGLDENFVDGGKTVEVVGPLYYMTSRKERHVNLLLIMNDEGTKHYCLIRDMSHLVRGQISKHTTKKYLCDGCLIFFSSETKLKEHQLEDCNHVRVYLPTRDLKKDKCGKDVPGHIMKFQDFDKKLKVPYVCYANFESCLEPIEDQLIPENHDKSYTIKTHKHIPYLFTYIIKCSYDDSQTKVETYPGPDASKVFMDRLENDVKRIYTDHLSKVHPILMSPEQECEFQDSTHCHIGEQPFQPEDEKVRDHDHLLPTNNYRGPSHSTCNLNFKVPQFIPIFFHNLSGYDAHLFIKDLAEEGSSVDVIAQNKERYISFSKHLLVGGKEDAKDKVKKVYFKLRFLDSMRFMAMSLDKLSKNLKDDQCVID